jgi:hypothetical protein
MQALSWLLPRLQKMASPNKPALKSIMVPGSGTAAGGARAGELRVAAQETESPVWLMEMCSDAPLASNPLSTPVGVKLPIRKRSRLVAVWVRMLKLVVVQEPRTDLPILS